MQAKFVLVKLCTSSFVKLCASEILNMCYPRNSLYLKIRASEIRASQGPPVFEFPYMRGLKKKRFRNEL